MDVHNVPVILDKLIFTVCLEVFYISHYKTKELGFPNIAHCTIVAKIKKPFMNPTPPANHI